MRKQRRSVMLEKTASPVACARPSLAPALAMRPALAITFGASTPSAFPSRVPSASTVIMSLAICTDPSQLLTWRHSIPCIGERQVDRSIWLAGKGRFVVGSLRRHGGLSLDHDRSGRQSSGHEADLVASRIQIDRSALPTRALPRRFAEIRITLGQSGQPTGRLLVYEAWRVPRLLDEGHQAPLRAPLCSANRHEVAARGRSRLIIASAVTATPTAATAVAATPTAAAAPATKPTPRAAAAITSTPKAARASH